MSSTAPPPDLRRNAQAGRKLCSKCKANLPARSDRPGERHKAYDFATCPMCREDARANKLRQQKGDEVYERYQEQRVKFERPPVRVIREVVIDGRTYEVIFDGT